MESILQSILSRGFSKRPRYGITRLIKVECTENQTNGVKEYKQSWLCCDHRFITGEWQRGKPVFGSFGCFGYTGRERKIKRKRKNGKMKTKENEEREKMTFPSMKRIGNWNAKLLRYVSFLFHSQLL